MAEKTVFIVQLGDDVVETLFKKNDWRQVGFLANKAYRREGEKILLSILMYPAVWSVENAIWQRDCGSSQDAEECSSLREEYERISKMRSECYERARTLVKEALRSQVRGVSRHRFDEIKLKKHKLVFKDELGHEAFVAEFPKTEWGLIWAACSQSCMMNEGQKFVLNYVTFSLMCDLRDVVWNRDYAYLFEYEPGSRSVEELQALWDEELGLKPGLLKTVKDRLFHCMD